MAFYTHHDHFASLLSIPTFSDVCVSRIRSTDELTSYAGYGGAKGNFKGDKLCYHNIRGVGDYGKAGAAEVCSSSPEFVFCSHCEHQRHESVHKRMTPGSAAVDTSMDSFVIDSGFVRWKHSFYTPYCPRLLVEEARQTR